MWDDEKEGFLIALRTAMPPLPADSTGRKYTIQLAFWMGYFAGKVSTGPFVLFSFIIVVSEGRI